MEKNNTHGIFIPAPVDLDTFRFILTERIGRYTSQTNRLSELHHSLRVFASASASPGARPWSSAAGRRGGPTGPPWRSTMVERCGQGFGPAGFRKAARRCASAERPVARLCGPSARSAGAETFYSTLYCKGNLPTLTLTRYIRRWRVLYRRTQEQGIHFG
jgi:hypothetical protein